MSLKITRLKFKKAPFTQGPNVFCVPLIGQTHSYVQSNFWIYRLEKFTSELPSEAEVRALGGISQIPDIMSSLLHFAILMIL